MDNKKIINDILPVFKKMDSMIPAYNPLSEDYNCPFCGSWGFDKNDFKHKDNCIFQKALLSLISLQDI